MKTHLIRFLLNLAISVLLIVATAEYGDKRLGIVETLEKQSYDWRLLRDIDPPKKRDDIVIVDIDDDSISELGPWPWPRGILAELVSQLFEEYDPLAVGFALPFSKPDDAEVRVLNKVKDALKKSGAYTFSLRRQMDELVEQFNNDKRFADALRKRNIVLGYQFTEFGGVDGVLPRGREFVGMQNKQTLSPGMLQELSEKWEFRRGFLGNLREFMDAAKGAGHLGLILDNDGVVRRAPLFIKHAGGYYSSMPLALLARSQNYPVDFAIDSDVEESGLLLSDDYVLDGFSIGGFVSKINPDGQEYLHFLGSGGRSVDFKTVTDAVFRYVPVADVISGAVSKDFLADKIVLVGSSSRALRDLYATPVNPEMPGVELMATELANLIAGDFLSRGAGQPTRELLTLAAVLIGLSAIFAFLGPVLSFFLAAAVGVGYVWFALDAWAGNVVWTMAPLLLAVAGLYVFTAISGFALEWRASRRLQSTFSQYVPPEFAKKMGQSGTKINLEGEGRELTVLFSDVRNFTSFSENLAPRDLTLLMNKMLTALTEAIHRHDGTVDKYIGDAVMAFWNAPIFDEEHAKKGVLAALDMQQTMNALSAELEKEGFLPMRLGVGLCTGDASVGNMGSSLRMTYTAIGDTVNLSSRTEGLTKYYKTPVLVTESTYEQCKDDIVFRAVDLVRVKGREQPVVLYEPLGQSQLIEPERLALVREFEEFRQTYHRGEFAKAAELLAAYREKSPEDGLAEVYAERLESLHKEAPADWDGVYVHSEK